LLLKLEQTYFIPAFELASIDEVLAYLSTTNNPSAMTSTGDQENQAQREN